MKLQMNVKFNVEERYKSLIEVCTTLGLTSKARLFKNFLSAAEKFKSVGPSKTNTKK